MKTKALILSILLIASGTIMAQRSGLKGGANFANLYVDDVSDENMKIGLNLGLWHQAANESFQAELNYSNKGAEVIYDGALGSGKYRYNLNYLEMPLLFVGHVGDFNLHVGPYLGFLVGVNIKDVDSNGNVNGVAQLDRDDFNTFDYGLSGGAAIEFDASQIGLRYNYGLREIGKSGSFAGEAANNAKNSVFQLYVALDF
ncbi:Outer membrane protein beta-barrel domain-containing protein [Ekhidna lutea]|uniref:Outer membrane protein beta-barrel domain-containing protein n=1 Tax=Ekhidna lutea TaxID=447679 RepID=A0A239KFG3_EKHLU|nr:porin family protein [Ekhidna lutea]SNT17096.1 Outer membrane protein beta-barrel domain-containing protein [Ekhidna lutea]